MTMSDYPTTCHNTSCPRHDQSESGCIDSSRHFVGLCVGFDPGPAAKCFGIGCPARSQCARFGGQKTGAYIEEAYNFVAGECANQD
jgi:hypothetical protein